MKVFQVSALLLLGNLSLLEARSPLPAEEKIVGRVLSQTRDYLAEFQHPESGVLYGARLATRDRWTTPEEVLANRPEPWGYGSRIADTVLHTGHMLVALLDAWEARPDPFLEKQIRTHFEALKMIGSLPETHPKPGKSDLVGLVPRGPHPDDRAAYFDDSSMDQHTTYIISLAIFSNSRLATEADRSWIKVSLGKVGRRLEKHDWSIKRGDGVTQAHVGFSWKGINSSHASILLPSVLALYRGTGDDYWRDRYESFLSESDGKRWELSHPGPHVRINGHPIYANQNAFRVNAWHRLESEPGRKKVLAGLLAQSAEMQLAREFPGEFYRKYHSEKTWKQVAEDFGWNDSELRGAADAWSKFEPDFLNHEESGLAALCHIRFPLGGFHMVLLSENPELIRAQLPAIWEMLTTVELEKVSAGETHYLFTVVGLHLYALYFGQPELFEDKESPSDSAATTFGREFSIVGDAGIGPTQDVAVDGNRAFAIGKGSLRILDIDNPRSPKLLGEISGLGGVRQIIARDGIAYISSRQDGLFIVDASDPSEPTLLSHYDTVEFATGLAISGDILFIACRHYGVELVDISNPKKPRFLSSVRTGEAQSVVARNGYLYVGVWATSEVVTVDYRDPYHPVVTSRAELDGFGDGVDTDGNFLYVATGHHSKEQPRKNPGDPGFGRGHGMEVFDLTDPAEPKWVSRIKFPPLYHIGNDTWRVTATNGHAFVCDTHNGFYLIDVGDPASPKFVGHKMLPWIESRDATSYVGGLGITHDHVFLAGGYSDLHVLPIPEIARPKQIHDKEPISIPSRDTAPEKPGPEWRSYRPGSQVYEAAFLEDDRAVVACGSGGVHLVSLWPEIKLLSRFDSQGFARDVSVSGNLVFVAESAGGLSIRKITKGSDQLETIGRFEFEGQAIRQVEVPGDGRFALLQSGANRFLILDVTIPEHPALVLEDTRHGLLYGDQLVRGLIEDRYTGVFWHVSGLHWYDLQAKPTPAFTGDRYPERLGSANGFVSLDDRVLATTRGGYLLLDRKETRSADEVGIHRVGETRHHLGVPSIYGDRLYCANRAEGKVTVIDIQSPTQPTLLEEIELSGNPARATVRNGSLVIPAGYQGLLIRDRKE